MHKIKMQIMVTVIAVLSFSCSSTHLIYKHQQDYYSFNTAVKNKSVSITKRSGYILNADDVRLGRDGIYIRPRNETDEKRLEFFDVRNLCYTDHGKGAIDGALIGAGSGFLIGFIAGSGQKTGAFSPGPAGYGAVGAIVAVLPGIIIGAIIGHRDYYQITTVPYE